VTDDNDGYIDISFDDDDPEPSGAIIEINLDDDTTAPTGGGAVPPRARRPSDTPDNAPGPGSERSLPMVAGGACPRCGYALRPLEETCPRCQQSVSEPVEKPVEKSPAVVPAEPESPLSAPEVPTASPQRGCNLYAIAGAILFISLAVGIPAYLWMQPGQRAQREYRAGLSSQLSGDFEGARQHYRAALGFDPQMGLAAFALGTTYLKIGDPAVVQSIQQTTERAVQGDTKDLDEADRWFQQAVAIGQNLAPTLRLTDQRISSPPRLRAFARACLALTALIRASAATQAEQYDDAVAWFGVATQQAQSAIIDDPNNAAATQILGAIPPVSPGTRVEP
jgi:hypothetical protein